MLWRIIRRTTHPVMGGKAWREDMRQVSDHPIRPLAVSVMADLLLIEAIMAFAAVILVFTSPIQRDIVELTANSVAVYVLFSLLYSVFSIACALGMLDAKEWARELYIGFVPVLMVVYGVLNGFHLPMIVGVIQYIVFVILLTTHSATEYFPSAHHYH